MQKRVKKAITEGTLKPYNLEEAQVGDLVVNFSIIHLKVIATHGSTVVFGVVGESQIYNFSQAMEHSNYLLPLAWLGDAPVYLGDVLYHNNGKSQYVVKGSSPGLLQVAPVPGGYHFTMPMTVGGSIPNIPNTWSLTPPFIEINGYKVPVPERKPLEHGTEYFVPHLWSGGIRGFKWEGVDNEQNTLNNGLVHLTEEAALAHVEALLSFTERKE